MVEEPGVDHGELEGPNQEEKAGCHEDEEFFGGCPDDEVEVVEEDCTLFFGGCGDEPGYVEKADSGSSEDAATDAGEAVVDGGEAVAEDGGEAAGGAFVKDEVGDR